MWVIFDPLRLQRVIQRLLESLVSSTVLIFFLVFFRGATKFLFKTPTRLGWTKEVNIRVYLPMQANIARGIEPSFYPNKHSCFQGATYLEVPSKNMVIIKVSVFLQIYFETF